MATKHQRPRAIQSMLPFVVLLFVCQFGCASRAFLHQDAGHLVLGNSKLELHWRTEGGQPVAQELVNRLSNRSICLSGDDFSIGLEGRAPLREAEMLYRGCSWQKIPGGCQLSMNFSGKQPAVDVRIIYELGDQDFFLRRRLEVSSAEPLALRQVDVWKIGLQDRCLFQETWPPDYIRFNVWDVEKSKGFGMPVLMSDSFWGLEYPAGLNQYAPGEMTLAHFPGRTVTGRFISKTAVVGVVPAGQVTGYFRKYISQYRDRPMGPDVQVDYNTWVTLMPETEKNTLSLLSKFRKNLFEPYGVAFDSFTLDDGWDEKNSLWSIRESGFPHGFQSLLDSLAPMGTKLGLWMSPSSGYEHAPWGATQGYHRNASYDWFLCQSDPNYRRDICRVVQKLIEDYAIGFFKLDGFSAVCDTDEHPYHLAGDYSKEANVDAYIELLTTMRKANPGIYLDPTSGMWLSPWWLKYVDSIYCNTYDGTPPAIVPSPTGLDGATTSRDALLRHRLADNPGFDPAAIETFGVYLDPTLAVNHDTFFDNWHDDAMIVAGRGDRLLDVYLDPAQFRNPPNDWQFLASLIRWTRRNAPLMAHTETILGDPYRREPYGYAHFLGPRGILVIRNPFIEPRAVQLTLDDFAGWSASDAGKEKYVASIVYPYRKMLGREMRYGDSFEIDAQPYQTLVVQVERASSESGSLAGVRCGEVSRGERSITWDLWGHPGETLSAQLLIQRQPRTIAIDGQKITPAKTARAMEIRGKFPGKARAASAVSGGRLYAPVTGGIGWLEGRCNAVVGTDSTASLYLLCIGTPEDVELECRAKVNGKEVSSTIIKSPSAEKIPAVTLMELPFKPWVFFRFNVPPGKSDIEVTVVPRGKVGRTLFVEAGWWLWVEHQLTRTRLTMDFDESLPPRPDQSLPLPSAMDIEREVLPIQSLREYELGKFQ